LELDPLFNDPSEENLDFPLEPESPAIDAGNPESDCSRETPDAEGGCRVDLGHHGNTATGQAR
jgi:hypothetical protein